MVSGIAPNGGGNLSGSGKRAGFPREARLLRHADFERVYKLGKRHFAKLMTVFYLRRADGEGSRVGFTVGRALGGAVQRNRMKRRLREALRLHGRFDVPVDVVINPKKSLLMADFADVQAEVVRAMQTILKAEPKKFEERLPGRKLER